ncbi:hypothetical protein BLA39750_01312 [Burkholderia lata]|uniref:Uncharacterized protein n=1 Tax=Burkholderia lata (strain ATCC 17760 / DSM 23089 / LMG 22485 / NCIMB 9086 / R18194 / 383) TaxID=482957 RepID=A0A6P2VW59_BURL3|nr:hypothetical protein [Burkholderia lata]VWC82584.1 hypothetical protein BLA39750_01312 [Burkholderia lata]
MNAQQREHGNSKVREYLFYIEGLDRNVWQPGESERAAYRSVWTALTDAEQNRVVQIECLDERSVRASGPTVSEAARALLKALGGDTPHWLRETSLLLEEALAREASVSTTVELTDPVRSSTAEREKAGAPNLTQETQPQMILPTQSREAIGGGLSFAIGALDHEVLKDLAADLGINFDKWTVPDDLRSDVLARYLEQGEPHLKFNYARSFWGSAEHSGPTETAYVPESLIAATCEDVAFGKVAHMDPIHIVSVDSDVRFTSSGVAFVGIALYRSAATGETQIERTDIFGELLDDAKELRDMKVELNGDYSPEDHQRWAYRFDLAEMSLTLLRGEPRYQEVLQRARSLVDANLASLGTKEREAGLHAAPLMHGM